MVLILVIAAIVAGLVVLELRSWNKPLTPGLRDRWEEHNSAVHATESEMSGRLLGGKPRSSSPRDDDGQH